MSMVSEVTQALCLMLLGIFIALPALAAWRRRRVSPPASHHAAPLSRYSPEVRRSAARLPLEAEVLSGLRRLSWADAQSLDLAGELSRAGPEVLANVAQRLATRLRRRVAFERKMLARTAPGLRRGALAALVPPVVVMSAQVLGVDVPPLTLLTLWFAELTGCLLLWRLARVEI
jgi:hypothetical protein